MSDPNQSLRSNATLDYETVKLIVEVAVPIIEELVKRIAESQSKIQQLLQKFDQLILREINSAFDALRDASFTDSEETRMRRLNYAEDQLLRCTGLELNTKIGDQSSAYWVGLAHFGLFTISKLRGDNKLAARHVLKTFAADPRTARMVHFPQVYETVFLPKCNDVKDWYSQKLAEIERQDLGGRVLGAKLKTGAKGLGILALGLFAMSDQNTRLTAQVTMKRGLEDTQKDWNNISPEKYRAEMRERLRFQYEEKLDLKCKTVAQEMLA